MKYGGKIYLVLSDAYLVKAQWFNLISGAPMKLVFPLLGITSQLTLCFHYKHVCWVHVNKALNGQ